MLEGLVLHWHDHRLVLVLRWWRQVYAAHTWATSAHQTACLAAWQTCQLPRQHKETGSETAESASCQIVSLFWRNKLFISPTKLNENTYRSCCLCWMLKERVCTWWSYWEQQTPHAVDRYNLWFYMQEYPMGSFQAAGLGFTLWPVTFYL